MVTLGIIGAGSWGANYLRAFSGLKNASILYVCSRTQKSVNRAIENSRLHSDVKASLDYMEVLSDKDVDAVAIATPASSHFAIAKDALERGKHVLVEKPVALNSDDVEVLIQVAKEKNRILMAGHIHKFNPGIQKIRKDIEKGMFGKIRYFSLLHFGTNPRNDIGAVWDFGPHFAYILLHLAGNPLSVNANTSFFNGAVEGLANINLYYPDGLIASSVCGWIFPAKKMELTVIGEKMSAVFNDYESGKLEYHTNKGSFCQMLDDEKPLTLELRHFLDCVENGGHPIADGNEALNATKILEKAEKSAKSSGQMINLR